MAVGKAFSLMARFIEEVLPVKALLPVFVFFDTAKVRRFFRPCKKL